ncbi:MAG: mandelate racemase/muconate lactonizing enzyme family protein [Candidatus Bathyarchaeia archaeon]
MKIKDIEAIPLSCPIPEEKAWRLGGRQLQDGRSYAMGQKGVKADMLILKVVTDEGIVGWGESFGANVSPSRGKAELEEMRPRLIGADPFKLIHTPSGGWGISPGIHIACWDIVGKALKKPLCELLGGPTASEVRPYASGGIDWNFLKDPKLIVEEAKGYFEEGFKAFKFRIPPDDRAVSLVKAIRDAFGNDLDPIVEANGRFRTAKQAIRIAKKFERYDPLWFEAPLPETPMYMHGYLEIAKAIKGVPISGGEGKLSAQEFKPWIDSHAYEIVQPDASIASLIEAKRVAYLAELEGLLCCPHNWGNAIANAANLHLVASIPNHYLLEFQRTWHWSCPAFRALEGTEILKDPLEMKNGLIQVPKKPGLGIEPDEEAFRKFPYKEGPYAVPWETPSL